MKWTERKEHGGYKKLHIFSLSILGCCFSVELIRCRWDKEVIAHTDCGCNKYRLMICLKEAEEGGKLECEKFILDTRRVKFYKASDYNHKISKVSTGERLDLSIGFDI